MPIRIYPAFLTITLTVTDSILHAAERLGIQFARARRESLQKTHDLAREAVSCNARLGALISRVMMKIKPGVRMIPGQRV